MMNNKFKKLFESIDEFLIKNDIKKIIQESTTVSPTDDELQYFIVVLMIIENTKKWIDDMYFVVNWEVIDYF